MLYKMITTARDRWYQSPECTANSVIEYIASKGQMRDAQVDAIKTYLYLKIACANRPLADLFISGTFNSLSIDDLEVSAHTRDFLNVNPAAAALYEYVTYANDKGDMVSEKTAKVIVKQPETIDYEQVFRDIFYGVSYPDYLFSLPMGERVIIVTGCINALISRITGTFIKNNSYYFQMAVCWRSTSP